MATMNASSGFNATIWQLAEDSIKYYTPALIFLGSLGNFISVVVFFSTKLRKLSSSTYLAALAINDTVMLACVLLFWLDKVADIGFSGQQAFCQIHNYCVYIGAFLSAWLVVAFTVERFVAVLYPLRRPSMCTVARARLVLLAMTALALVVCLPAIFMVKSQAQTNGTDFICGIDESRETLAKVFNDLDTFFTLVVPFLVIATLNTCIVSTVWRLAWVRRSMTLTVRGDAFVPTASQHSRRRSQSHLRSSSSHIKVTKMLLLVSTVFLILNLPHCVFRIMVYVQEPEQHTVFTPIQHLSQLLYYTNFGINFVLYCVSGQNFRRALASMCCPRRRRDTTPFNTVVSEYLRSSGSIAHRRTVTLNDTTTDSSWKEAHELLPLTK